MKTLEIKLKDLLIKCEKDRHELAMKNIYEGHKNNGTTYRDGIIDDLSSICADLGQILAEEAQQCK